MMPIANARDLFTSWPSWLCELLCGAGAGAFMLAGRAAERIQFERAIEENIRETLATAARQMRAQR